MANPSSRRAFFRQTAGVGLALYLGLRTSPVAAQPASDQGSGPYALPDLPYGYGDLEPVIDERIMRLHHDKHHAGYVRKLNEALAGAPEVEARPVEALIADIPSLPEGIRTAVRNQGGGHANHSLFWELMRPPGHEAAIPEELGDTFGGEERLRKAFAEAALGVFGSGWAWVIRAESGKLKVVTTPNQDSPLMRGVVAEAGVPILGLDVWEHAYYLQYENRRAEYVENFWRVINWEVVGTRMMTQTGR